jgi:hypothetical protein
VWKEPAFFLTHPLASPPSAANAPAAACRPHRVAVRLAVPHLARHPADPSDKVPVEDGKTKILLLRVGEKRQGVTACSSPAAGEQGPGLSVRFMGINRNAIASYLISCTALWWCTEDALAVLDDVEVGKYHDYSALDTYK